jgi:hypothetical protein
MSMSASGSVGGVLTFGTNKGRNFVRRLVIPANPNTPSQQGVRSAMKWIGAEWAQLSAGNQATWETRGAQTNISPFAAFSGKALDNWSNGAAPQREDPAEVVTAPGAPTSPADSVTERRATFTWVESVSGVIFGTVIHISPTTGFTAGRDNAIIVVDQGELTAITKNLEPGTYFYRLRHFSPQGMFGAAAAEGSFVIA